MGDISGAAIIAKSLATQGVKTMYGVVGIPDFIAFRARFGTNI